MKRILLLTAVALVGCGGSQHTSSKPHTPTCDEITDHFVDLVRKEAPADRPAPEDAQLDAIRTEINQECEKAHLGEGARQCAIAAKSVKEIMACHDKDPTPPPPVTPTPPATEPQS